MGGGQGLLHDHQQQMSCNIALTIQTRVLIPHNTHHEVKSCLQALQQEGR